MKNGKRSLAMLLSLVFLAMLLPVQALALSGDINDPELSGRITVKESEPGMALADSTAMLLRRSAWLEGAGSSVWRGFTENYVVTANGGASVPGSRSYTASGYNYTVRAYRADSLSEADWRNLLADHPEGVVLRFRNAGNDPEQGVLLTHCDNGTFYCLDPDPATDAGLLDICASGFGRSAAIGSSKTRFFEAVTYYYAVSDGILAHTHTYATEGDSLGACTECGYVYYLDHQSEISGKATPAEGLTAFSLKEKPYSASGTVQVSGTPMRISAGTVIGITTNHYGNTWYLIESLDKSARGYVWEDNLVVARSSALLITGVSVPVNNAVAGIGAKTELTGTVTATGAQLTGVTAAVYGYDALNSAELNSILYNTLDQASAAKLAEKRADTYASAVNVEKETFSLSRFSSKIRFDALTGGRKYLYTVTATDDKGNSATVYNAFYLSNGLETQSDHTVRLSVAGSVTEKTVSAGGSLTLPERSRSGYTFLGWSEQEGTEAEYAPGTRFTPKADVTLYAVFKKIKAPSVPSLTPEKTDAAIGETVSLQAGASGAESYTVYVYSGSTLVRTQSFRSGKLSLAFEKAGTYTVKAEAFAGDSGSGASSAVTVTVHAPVTVTFMNGDNIWAQEQVDYGSDAAEPAEPTRPGSSFTGWDGSLSNIREDTVLHAGFASGAFTVTFVDEKGNTLSRQQVALNASATAPEPPEKPGYAFLSWDTDAWQHVTENDLFVAPVYIKETADTVSLALTGVETAGSGKLVAYTLTNSSGSTAVGSVRLTGRTASGAVKVETSGSVFVLGPGESFSEKIFVLQTDPVLWELVAADAAEELLAAPVLFLSSGDGESVLWVSESEARDIGVTYKKLEETKQYSTASSETYTSPASTFLDWDKKSGSEAALWSAWSDWQTEPVTAGKSVEVEKRQVVTVPEHREYRYGRWYAEDVTRTATDEKHPMAVSPSLAYAKSAYRNASTAFAKQFSPWSTARFTAADSFRTKYKDNEKTYYSAASGAYFWHVYYLGEPSENTAYFWEEYRTVPAVTETQYRYRVRAEGEENNIFTHKKTPVWSFTSVKNASTRKVLRIRFSGTAGGDPVDLTGSLGRAAANRQAVLTVLMSDGNGHENTYTEQIRLDGSGSYSVTVADLSGLSVINAPCRVYLTLAGSTDRICIGSFLSAGSNCTVRFADGLTGELLNEQTVRSGETAQAPAAPAHEGYLFIGWNRTGAHITEDTVIMAEYERETYTVIFSDSIAGTETAVSGVPYGRAVEAPKVRETEGYTFIGWSVPEGASLDCVTEPMRAEAVYTENLHTVTYLSAPRGYEAGGTALTDTLAVVTVRDGEYVTAPEITGNMHIPDSMYFIGWSEGAADPVTADLILVPVLGCVLDAEEAVPSLPGGLYAQGEKLTLHAADTAQLIVRYRFNTAKAKGDWTEYDIKHSPAITLSSSGELEIESVSPDKSTKRAVYAYTVASSGTLPAAPTLRSAAQTDTQTVTVTWSAVKNVKGYILTRVSDCGEVCTHMLTGTTFEDEGLCPQRSYTYSVTAYTVSEKDGSSFLLEGNSSKTVTVRFYGAAKPVQKITVSAPKTVYTDSSVQLEATVSPADAADQAIYWTIDSGSSHGSVTQEGVFTALSAGSVTVSARATDYSGVVGTAKITVKEPEKNSATLSVSSVSARGGSTAKITVSLSEGSQAETIHFTVRYNSSKLTLKSAKKGDLVSGASVSVNTDTKGYVVFTYDDDVLTDSGPLLELSFSVKSSATGSAYVQIATEDDGCDLELLDNRGQPVTLAIKNGAVNVRNLMLGDVDDSGTVDVEDAYIIRRYLNGDETFTAEQKQAADVNGDGKVTSADITLIRQYIVRIITVFPAEE